MHVWRQIHLDTSISAIETWKRTKHGTSESYSNILAVPSTFVSSFHGPFNLLRAEEDLDTHYD